MIVTRHISLDKDCIEKIGPFVEKHNGNFSAAVRDIIDMAGSYGSLRNSTAIDSSLFKWMLSEIEGRLVPENVLDEILDPGLISSMNKLNESLQKRFKELEWDIDVNLKSDNDASPSKVFMQIKGAPQKVKFIATILCQYLIKNLPENESLKIASFNNFGDCLKIELSKSNKKEAYKILRDFLGEMDEVIETIKNRQDFWRNVMYMHLLSDYSMITVHRNYFEDLLAGKIPMGEITMEMLAKKTLKEIPLKEMLTLIKEVYEISKVADRVEIDRETLILFHSYRNMEVVEKITKSLISLLDSNGHSYQAKLTSNMIVLTHRPDLGIKIDEIVDRLKMSSSTVDQQLIVFMAFLKGMKDFVDIPQSLSTLGRRIGRSLMQDYEKENGISKWDMENFRNAFEKIHSKLRIESDWRVEGKKLLYNVKNCYLVAEENTFSTYVCHIIRETFKEAVIYAFGSRAEFEIKKSLPYGDKFCEVIIRIP